MVHLSGKRKKKEREEEKKLKGFVLPGSSCLNGIVFSPFSFSVSFLFSVRAVFEGYRLPTNCKRTQRTRSSSSKSVRYSVQIKLVLSLCRRAFIICLNKEIQNYV